jgi:hypothetical protein
MGICGEAGNSTCSTSMAFAVSPGSPLPVSISPTKPFSLPLTRGGTLWIGTYAGLAAWSGGKLPRYLALDGLRVTSLREDREGTGVGWPTGRLLTISVGADRCFGKLPHQPVASGGHTLSCELAGSRS